MYKYNLYIKKNILMSNLWGFEAWTFLHIITFNYSLNPNFQEKKNYYQFFKNIGNVLPCSDCQIHYNKIFKYIDIKLFLENRYGLIWWLYVIHNLINKKINKQIYKFENLIKKYHTFNQNNNCSSCSNKINDEYNNIHIDIKKKYYNITKNLISNYINNI